MNSDFVPFPKIFRWNREVIVTEKIDGTNGLIEIDESGDNLRVGSRTRWVTPESDNYGFARWAEENKKELLKLGPGRHHGEWWGSKIQRRYSLKEKRFSLFNTSRWSDPDIRPACVNVVPVLWTGMTIDLDVNSILHDLKKNGSRAAPGFMNPEGIVIFHVASNQAFKMTLDKNDEHKITVKNLFPPR